MSARATAIAACLVLLPLAAHAGKPRPEARCGIEPVSTRLSASGFLVDFRYRVTDAELAKPLFHDGIHPTLTDRKTGRKLATSSDSKLGSLRSSPRTTPTVGRTYYVLFSNSERSLRAGSRVEVAMGSCRLRHLRVE